MRLDTFIHRPVLSTVISIIIVILGVIGLIALPTERYPNIAPPTVMVQAAYPGANAQTVLNSVITPLEESINGVENMTYMTIWLRLTCKTVLHKRVLCCQQK